MRLMPVVALAAASCAAPTTETVAPVDTTPATVWSGAMNLPPQLTHATVTAQAARAPAIQVSEPPPAPTTTQLMFADDCAEMSYYRQQVGLPQRFDSIGWRESNCRNEETVHTFCCWGWWQLYVSVHLNDHRLAPRYALCGIGSRFDVDSDTPEDKQRQACGAKAVYDIQGAGAWST